jgi:hypothetical protein
MKKLYRSALFAGVLAFGVAACGDDVQLVEQDPPPPPPLQVSLTPSNQTINVGETADFAVGVSGGAEGAQASWTCSSSNTGVASVATTDTGCRVTGAEAGNASITVTVTKGNQSANAGAQVTVNPGAADDIAATVSIASITQGGLTQPVDIDNVSGQIDVTLNVNPNDQTVTKVTVLVDGEPAASQDLASGAFEWVMLESDDAAAEQVQQITLSFNTARYDVDGLVATPRYLNGQHQIQAEIEVAESDDSAASNEITLNFNNDDGFHVLANFGEDTNQAMDSDGRAWWGGPDTELFVTPIPVMFSGATVTNMSVNVSRLQAGAPGATERCRATPITRQIDDTGDLTFEFSCSGAEANLMVPMVTSVASGNDGPSIMGTSLADYSGVLNLTAATDHPFPARIDVRAPQRVDAGVYVYRMIRQASTLNVGNWVNALYNFHGASSPASARTYNSSNTADAGVGKASAMFAVSTDAAGNNIVAGPAATLTGANLNAAIEGGAESLTNTTYRAWAVQPDRLGNTAFFLQEENPADHPLRSFGYDETTPMVDFEDDEDIVGALAENFSIIEQFGMNDGVLIRATDNLSGFSEVTGASHSIVWVRGQFNGEGAIETGAIVSSSSSIVSTPFATAAAGGQIVAPSLVPPANVDYINQTAVQIEITNLGAVIDAEFGEPAPARYYIYQIVVRDQAGNVYRDYRAVYVNNESVPTVEFLSNPMTFDGDATYEAAVMRDSVEVEEASLEIRYRNAAGPMSMAGTLVWERPGSDLSSVLRMNADISDGVLFNDVIYRPQYDVAMPLGLSALGLPFINSLQTVNPDGTPNGGSIATSKPDSTRARIYNGFGADQDDYNHSTAPFTGATGISAVISRSIDGDELADADFDYSEDLPLTDPDGWTFTIVDDSAPDCDDYCVRAIGPLSQFVNPFNGGPVLIVWADDAGTGVAGELQWRVLTVATPNFTDPFPTRDSGADRLYEWTFSLSGANPGDLIGNLALGAIGVRTNPGSALLTTSFVAAPDPEFNVVFDPTSDDLVNIAAETVAFDLLEGPNSTLEGIATTTCQFVDGVGNVIVIPPTGLTLTAVGNSCVVETDGTADVGETHIIRGNATGNDGGVDSATATVTVIAPPFVVDLQPNPATAEIPNAAGSPIDLDFQAVVTSGDAISAFSCSVTAATGVTVTEVAPDLCRVSVTDAASAGNVTVSVNATETGTGQTDSDTAVLTLESLNIAFDPVSTEAEPTELSWLATTQIDVVVSGSRDNTDIDTIACDTGLTWLTATPAGDGCEFEITTPGDAVPGDYPIEYTIVFLGDGRTEVVDAYVTVPEAPEFAPVFDIETAEDNRRETERNRTLNFRVIDGFGLGIDEAATAATVVVTPSATGVTASFAFDAVDEEYRLEVVVDAAANPGNYEIDLTFFEDGTTTEIPVTVYVRVLDTGVIEVGGL